MNVDNSLPPPICQMPGRAWDSIAHDDTVSWLGYYKQETDDNVDIKYIHLGSTSEMKCKPDLMKYERARRLCTIVNTIRKDYQWKLKHGDTPMKKQLGREFQILFRTLGENLKKAVFLPEIITLQIYDQIQINWLEQYTTQCQ